MASIHGLWIPISILLFCSLVCFATANPERRLLQSNSPPQNIETFFPSLPSPAFTNPSPQPPPPPLPPPPVSPPQSPPSEKTNNENVTKAVVATAASSFALSGLLFFAFQRFFSKQHRQAQVGDSHDKAGGGGNRFRSNPDGGLKGVIVDENGLDVLYWRKLDEPSPRRCDHCNHVFGRKIEGQDRETQSHERDDMKVQERPLLPNNSLNSSARISPGLKVPDRSNSSSSSGITVETIARARLAHAAPPTAPVPPPRPPPPPKSTPPPPPPPPALTKNLSPPPPPPPKPPLATNKNPPGGGGGGGASSSRPPPSAMGVESGGAHTKLKPLHWDKVALNRAEHSMVWDKITEGSFRVDDDLMEALFGYVATNRKSPTNSNNNKSSFSSSTTTASTSPPAQFFLLDPHKSQNVAIVLRSLALSRQDILDALLEGRGLSPDTLEKLSKIAPTKEEESHILDFTGNPSKLADADSFLFHLLCAVPSPFARLDAMLFKSNYEADILHLKQSHQHLELACNELRTRGLFLKLLEAILKAGNRMNAGTARGDAQAFNLTALCKLSDVKSTDKKTTLLHFVVEEVVRSEGKRCVINRNHSVRRSMSRNNSARSISGSSSSSSEGREEREREYTMLGLPAVGGLSTEFANVKKAAAIDYDTLVGTCSSLGARVSEIRRFLGTCGDGGGFVKEMRGFVEAAEVEVAAARGEEGRVMEMVRRTTEYYQVGAAKDKGAQPLQLFVIVRDFLGMVDQVCVDLTRNLQKKRPPPAAAAAGGGGSPAAERRAAAVRFPNLPAHFMSDNLKSPSSSDSEDGMF